jgi:hypothetical protein
MSILAFVLILCFVFQALYQYLNLISASTVKDILRESLTMYVHIMALASYSQTDVPTFESIVTKRS